MNRVSLLEMSKILLLKPHHGFCFLSHSRQLSTIFSRKTSLHAIHNPHRSQNARCLLPIRAIESSSTKEGDRQKAPIETAVDDGASHPTLLQSSPSSASRGAMASGMSEYPSGEYEMPDLGWWMNTMVKLRMMFVFPWEHVKKGSVLSMKLRGRITDQLTSRFSPGMSLPQICENFLKAANDPRISGIYIHIEPLSCGWGKIDEIRRHILNFRKSGKFTVSYIPICGEKEYYLACACGEVYAPPSAYVLLYGLNVQASFLGGVLEKIGVDPQIQQIGKYKGAGDLLVRKGMSKENREMLTSLLNDIYGNWLETISSTLGKTLKEVEEFINTGVYQVEKLKENGWITNTLYDDEVMSILKDKLGQTNRKNLLKVDYGKYCRVRKWTLGLHSGGDQIAIIRASGSISRSRSLLSFPGNSIIAEQLIEKIRSARESEKYKAVVLRIDSPGGDALASDLLWREIKLLAATKPVIASMSDVAASGGYYMAMAANTVVAENLTLTGSIGVVTGKFNLSKFYERIGFNKEIISRGKYAELLAAEQRPFRPDEAELFEKSAKNVYKQFRDKAAISRSMTVDEMEQVAQGRVWTGKTASSLGLVDAIGGFSRAIAIAKQKANIPHDRQVRLVEMSKPSPSLSEIASSIGSSIFGLDGAVKDMLQEGLSSSSTMAGSVQAKMEGCFFESLGKSTFEHSNPIFFSLIKDYFSSF